MKKGKMGLCWIFAFALLPVFLNGADLYVFDNGANVNGQYDGKLKIFKLCTGEIIKVNVDAKNVRVGAGNCSNETTIAYAPMTLKEPVSTMATIKTLDTAIPGGTASAITAYIGLDMVKGSRGGVSVRISPTTLEKLLRQGKVKVTYDKKDSVETLGLGNAIFEKTTNPQTGKDPYFQESNIDKK